MDTLEILIAARAEVEKGWCKFFAVSTDDRVCAMGAIDVACGADRTPREFCRLAGLESQRPGAIPHWNDDHRTTKEDVLDLYQRAIDAELAKVSSDPAHTFVVA